MLSGFSAAARSVVILDVVGAADVEVAAADVEVAAADIDAAACVVMSSPALGCTAGPWPPC